MKNILYILTIGVFLSFSCVKIKSDTKSSDMKEYKCSFEGDSQDISNFLGKDFIKGNDISLQLFANQYLFLSKEESLMMYVYNNKNNVFETFKLKEISTQLKKDRKYQAEITDSTKNGFTLNIKSSNNNFTKMTNNIVVKCTVMK